MNVDTPWLESFIPIQRTPAHTLKSRLSKSSSASDDLDLIIRF